LTLDNTLYEFDAQAEERIAHVQREVGDPTPQQRESATTQLEQLLNEQKAALRDQRQVLTALVLQGTKLLKLKQEYRQMFAESYFATFNELLWLRTSEPLGWTAVRNTIVDGGNSLRHLWTFLYTETFPLQNAETGPSSLVSRSRPHIVTLPFIRRWRKYGRGLIEKLSLGPDHPRCGKGAVLVSLGRSAVWPAYLFLVTKHCDVSLSGRRSAHLLFGVDHWPAERRNSPVGLAFHA
jgi:hypothetical protein